MSEPAFPGRLNEGDPDLTERQRQVFAALIALYGRMARPVSSEALARDTGLGLSSASIRSALAELEALGLLERLHSSAGGVPTARGYEFYVRAMLAPEVLSEELVREVSEVLRRSTRDVEHLLDEASRLLSTLTRQLGLAFAASLAGEQLWTLDLAALAERRALMVLGFGGGGVHSLVLELESNLTARELEEVSAVLRERLLARSLAEVRRRFATDPELVRDSAVRIVSRAAAESWTAPKSTPLFSAGAVHIAEQPEFAGSVQLVPILRMVEAGSPLDRLMIAGIEGQVAVRVGLDHAPALAGLSLVSYALPGTVRGAVGILGPLRMDYSRVLPVVETIGNQVADLLHS